MTICPKCDRVFAYDDVEPARANVYRRGKQSSNWEHCPKQDDGECPAVKREEKR